MAGSGQIPGNPDVQVRVETCGNDIRLRYTCSARLSGEDVELSCRKAISGLVRYEGGWHVALVSATIAGRAQ